LNCSGEFAISSASINNLSAIKPNGWLTGYPILLKLSNSYIGSPFIIIILVDI
jgi:hypothetical protein